MRPPGRDAGRFAVRSELAPAAAAVQLVGWQASAARMAEVFAHRVAAQPLDPYDGRGGGTDGGAPGRGVPGDVADRGVGCLGSAAGSNAGGPATRHRVRAYARKERRWSWASADQLAHQAAPARRGAKRQALRISSCVVLPSDRPAAADPSLAGPRPSARAPRSGRLRPRRGCAAAGRVPAACVAAGSPSRALTRKDGLVADPTPLQFHGRGARNPLAGVRRVARPRAGRAP